MSHDLLVLQSPAAIEFGSAVFLGAPHPQNRDNDTGDDERPNERGASDADKRNGDDPEPQDSVYPLLPHTMFFDEDS